MRSKVRNIPVALVVVLFLGCSDDSGGDGPAGDGGADAQDDVTAPDGGDAADDPTPDGSEPDALVRDREHDEQRREKWRERQLLRQYVIAAERRGPVVARGGV